MCKTCHCQLRASRRRSWHACSRRELLADDLNVLASTFFQNSKELTDHRYIPRGHPVKLLESINVSSSTHPLVQQEINNGIASVCPPVALCDDPPVYLGLVSQLISLVARSEIGGEEEMKRDAKDALGQALQEDD